MIDPETDRPQQDRTEPQGRLEEIRLALLLLTRIPLPLGKAAAQSNTAAAAWVFPLVGALVGLAGGIAFILANRLGLGLATATLLAIATQVLLTGALHEDGLADTADGLGGGRDRDHKLAIMRDSRIGTYGVVALLLALGLRFAAISELANSLISTSDEYDQTVSHTSAVMVALVTAGALSRAAMAAIWCLLPAARSDGLAASSGQVRLPTAIVSMTIAILVTFLLLAVTSFAGTVLAVVVTAGLVALLAKRQIGGHTGDVLGATQQLTEIAALLAISALTVAI